LSHESGTGSITAVVTPASQPTQGQPDYRSDKPIPSLVAREHASRLRFIEDSVLRAEAAAGDRKLHSRLCLQVSEPVGGRAEPDITMIYSASGSEPTTSSTV
jgi:hypothetical protein